MSLTSKEPFDYELMNDKFVDKKKIKTVSQQSKNLASEAGDTRDYIPFTGK